MLLLTKPGAQRPVLRTPTWDLTARSSLIRTLAKLARCGFCLFPFSGRKSRYRRSGAMFAPGQVLSRSEFPEKVVIYILISTSTSRQANVVVLLTDQLGNWLLCAPAPLWANQLLHCQNHRHCQKRNWPQRRRYRREAQSRSAELTGFLKFCNAQDRKRNRHCSVQWNEQPDQHPHVFGLSLCLSF